MLRPGAELLKELGGIHAFCGWNGPILSDSGGFQVFSLKKIRKISEEGVEFRSYLDGAKYFLSPERSLEIQQQLGVDIAMAFDECPSAGLTHPEVERSLELTLRWAKRSLRSRQSAAVFGITQGGTFADLRKRAAEELAALSFDGYAIGGLSEGEAKGAMYEVLEYHPRQLPTDRIRYLMGVGTPEDILEAVRQGVDLFDCVIPTRAGRFGRAYTNGPLPFLNIKNSCYATDSTALDSQCQCVTCRNYSKAYLNHLFKVGEMLGPQLLTVHNLTHYLDLMGKIRKSILSGTFLELYQHEKSRWRGFQEN
jgi:queuine tRNA-ribosyltransferase